jgi:hypothetical protein
LDSDKGARLMKLDSARSLQNILLPNPSMMPCVDSVISGVSQKLGNAPNLGGGEPRREVAAELAPLLIYAYPVQTKPFLRLNSGARKGAFTRSFHLKRVQDAAASCQVFDFFPICEVQTRHLY